MGAINSRRLACSLLLWYLLLAVVYGYCSWFYFYPVYYVVSLRLLSRVFPCFFVFLFVWYYCLSRLAFV